MRIALKPMASDCLFHSKLRFREASFSLIEETWGERGVGGQAHKKGVERYGLRVERCAGCGDWGRG